LRTCRSREKYLWRSYLNYIGKGKATRWLTTDWLLWYFCKTPAEAQKKYRGFVESNIGLTEGNPLKEAIASTILGRPAFIEEIKRKYLGNRERGRDVPAVGVLTRQTPGEILESLQLEFQDWPEYTSKAAIYLSHRFSGISLKEIGKHFGIKESAVSQASRRFESALSLNMRFRENAKKAGNALYCVMCRPDP
jgi:hypothetical protein